MKAITMKKYLLCPGHVISATDGQRHFVGVGALIQLYGVNPKECALTPAGHDGRRLIHLFPRDDGDYTLPE